MDVEMRTAMKDATAAALGVDTNDRFAKTVGRINLHAALREGREESPDKSLAASAAASAASVGGGGGRQHQHQLLGPLTQQELSDLSLLCHANASLTTTASKVNNNNNNMVSPFHNHDSNNNHKNGNTDNSSGTSSSSSNNNNNDTSSSTTTTNGDRGVGFAAVEGDQLVSLVETLDKHVNHARRVHFVQDAVNVINKADAPSQAAAALAKWTRSGGKGNCLVTTLKQGLEAACIILSIATSPDVDKRAVNEDAIEACIALQKNHLRNNLVPSLNQTGHMLGTKSLDAHAENVSPSKKRRRKSSEGVAGGKDLNRMYHFVVQETMSFHLILMDLLVQLVHTVPLDDQQILMLTDGSLSALEIDCAFTAPNASHAKVGSTAPPHQLQLSAIAIVTAAFRMYPGHRDTILEDLFPLMLRLPTGKRSLRAFPVRYASGSSPDLLAAMNSALVVPMLSSTNYNYSENAGTDASNKQQRPHFIQMITALVLSLVQACVQRPTYEEVNVDPDDNEGNAEEVATQQRLASGLRVSMTISNAFVHHLLQRCARKGSSGTLEFRPILANLVEDLLLVLLIPEYTAAEMLLQCLTRRIHDELAKAMAAAQSGQAGPETTFLTAAFDTLSRVCSTQARILAAQRRKPLKMTTKGVDPSSSQDDSDTMQIECYCGSKDSNHVLIGCEICSKYFHGKCVGVTNDNAPDEWFCDSCRLERMAHRERRKHNDGAVKSIMDELFAMHQSFLACLSHRKGVTEIEDAIHFHLARWVDELDQKALSTPTKRDATITAVQHLLEYWENIDPAADVLTGEAGNRVILALTVRASSLFLYFRPIIHFLVKLMSSDSSPLLRKNSLKTIEKTAEGDPQLMLFPVITKAVAKRLSDDAISVREAAVSLIGAYVVQSPAVARSYHTSLLACLDDVGVSVRKRAIRIFQDILSADIAYRNQSEVCRKMLERAADPKEEDGVRDLIHDVFVTLWLQTDGVTRRRSSLGSPSPAPRKRIDVAAKQMMEVVRDAETGEYFETLLRTLLGGNADADKSKKKTERKKRRDLGHQHCTQLVNSLVELLVSIEEQREGRGAAVGADIAATLQTISIFGAVSPQSVLPHIQTILPYLKADNGVSAAHEALIVKAGCDILYRAKSIFERRELTMLAGGSLPYDLEKITYKFGPDVCASAVGTLSTLAHYDGLEKNPFKGQLLKLYRNFYSVLYKHIEIEDFSTASEKDRSNTHRALTVLGFICQHHETAVDAEAWTDEIDGDTEGNLPDKKDICWSNVTIVGYRVLFKYLQKDDAPTKCSALRALGYIFVTHPRLLLELEKVGLITEVMDVEAPLSLQREALQCWKRILEAEEKRVDSGNAKKKMASNKNVTLSKRISGDQDSDSTLFGGVLTSHSERLFTMTSSPNRLLRHAAVELLETLLRQGLLNPNETVPYLFALQGDVDNERTRKLALHLLTIEGDKRPDMLRQRICVGVKRAYEFQRAMYPKKHDASALTTLKHGDSTKVECIMSSVYRECIGRNKKQRQGLFKNLLGLFEWDDDADTSPSRHCRSRYRHEDHSADLALLSFTSQILAHLPYNAALDPLYIIYNIGSIVALQGNQILEKFASLLRPVGLASSDELDEVNATEDALERAAKSKFPSRTHEASNLSDDEQEFDLAEFAEQCRHGAAIILLLRLKSYLRHLYNLSETRCIEYDPDAKERVGDRGISKVETSKPFDASVRVPASLPKTAADKDALIRQYAEFRSLMRAEVSAEPPMDIDADDADDGDGDNDDNDEGSSSLKRAASDLEDEEEE